MKASLLLCTAALVAATGGTLPGMIDATAPAGSPASQVSPAVVAPKNPVPDRIAHGEEVNIEDHVVPGKTTIFIFTSEFCPPCRAIAPRLHKLHATRADVVVVEVDLNRPGLESIDWTSPVARQYNVHSIPNFKVYGPDGKLQAEGNEAADLVRKMLK